MNALSVREARPVQRIREAETARMLRAIDEKIARLTAARTDRHNALLRIRGELVQAQQAAPIAPDFHADNQN